VDFNPFSHLIAKEKQKGVKACQGMRREHGVLSEQVNGM
jgi:hypothetical protein